MSSKLGAAALSSSPIEEPTPLPSNAKPKPRKASPDSPLKGVERQMSAHATTNKRTKVVKLADRAKKTPEAGPSSLADLSSSSRNADTVDCADPAAGPSKGKKVPAKAPAKVAKSVTKTKDKNKKAPKCTPYEYALSLQEKMLLRAEKPKEHKFQFLKGKVFFYIGSDMIYASQSTRGRMDYVCALLDLGEISLSILTRSTDCQTWRHPPPCVRSCSSHPHCHRYSESVDFTRPWREIPARSPEAHSHCYMELGISGAWEEAASQQSKSR